MISDALSKATTDISKLTYLMKDVQDSAKCARKREAENRKEAIELEKKALEYELKIDQLQIEMRKILNGEPSDIPVEMPIFEEDQVGRVG